MNPPISPVRSTFDRLPPRREIIQVLGLVLFVVFGWSIRGFLFKLPAFTLYFGLSANLAILCYMAAFALIESLIVTGLLLLLGAALPARWLRKGFVYKSFLIVLVASIAVIIFEAWYRVGFFKDLQAGSDYPIPPFVAGVIAAFAILFALLWLFQVKPAWQRPLNFVVEQLSLFTYIYVPLGLLGLLVVLLRNMR